MSQPDKMAVISEMVAPLAASLGLVVWGIEIVGTGRPVARIYVDISPAAQDENTGGVTVDQCAELSRLAGLALDVEDPFPDNWTLEVSSPGLERPFFSLEQLHKYIGQEIELSLVTALADWPGRKHFSGFLASVEDADFVLNLPLSQRLATQPDHVSIPWEQVRRANLVHHFNQPQKPGKNKESIESNASGGVA